MVVEAGHYTLPDCTVIEAGTVGMLSGEEWTQTEFFREFENAPVVISQIVTKNSDQPFVTRMQ